MRFVPYIGKLNVAAGIPILLAAAVDPSWSLTLWVAALFLVTEPIIGQLVEPMLYGRSTVLSPISVNDLRASFGVGSGDWFGPHPVDPADALPRCAGAARGLPRISDAPFGPPGPHSPESRTSTSECSPAIQTRYRSTRKNCSRRCRFRRTTMRSRLERIGIERPGSCARKFSTRPQVECIKEAVTTLVTELADYDDVDPGTAPKASPDRSAAEDLPKHPAPAGAMPEKLETSRQMARRKADPMRRRAEGPLARRHGCDPGPTLGEAWLGRGNRCA